MSSKNTLNTNHEILFVYDAENANPNGDPDNENKPRMDTPTSTNLVTDLRLKRYVRDYLEGQKKLDIYVTKPEGLVLNATNRLKFWEWRKENKGPAPGQDSINKTIEKVSLAKLTTDTIKQSFIDVRMFGATVPLKGDESSAQSFTGPIQFTWGKSLNQVEMVDSSTITSHFASGTGTQGTIGTDYRVHYSLIAFHGVISAKRASETGLSAQDIDLLDEAMVRSIPLLATRSKIGQYPRLYMRVAYTAPDVLIGDFRKNLVLENKKGLRSIQDVKLKVEKLLAVLQKNDKKIQEIVYWKDDKLVIEPGFDKLGSKARSL